MNLYQNTDPLEFSPKKRVGSRVITTIKWKSDLTVDKTII